MTDSTSNPDDVVTIGQRCKEEALAAIASGDGHAVYQWTKSWVSAGGGGHIPDAWLVYAVSGLLDGQPRRAVHCFDMALRTWITGTTDRAVLTWCRGLVVMNVLNDPTTALLDLEPSIVLLPDWLATDSQDVLDRCREAAARSRKRKPSVAPRPEHDSVRGINLFAPGAEGLSAFAPDVSDRDDGDQPDVWPIVAPFFEVPT